MGLGLAFRCFFRALRDSDFAKKIQPLLSKEESQPAVKGSESLRLLGILQRDGRLVDFLMEDITGYSDEQVGSAVRDIHRDCGSALKKYLDLAPVVDGKEDEPIEVPAGFDPTRIRLTGPVKGQPPFRGIIAHRGWRVATVRVPDLAKDVDPLILAPAEVEVS